MYLQPRLLLGIAAVTLVALLLSVLIPLGSVRPDVARETDSTLQLTSLLVKVEDSVRAAPDAATALSAAAAAVTPEDAAKAAERQAFTRLRSALAEVATWHGTLDGRALGKWLGRHKGRPVDGRKFVSEMDPATNTLAWKLVDG